MVPSQGASSETTASSASTQPPITTAVLRRSLPHSSLDGAGVRVQLSDRSVHQ